MFGKQRPTNVLIEVEAKVIAEISQPSLQYLGLVAMQQHQGVGIDDFQIYSCMKITDLYVNISFYLSRAKIQNLNMRRLDDKNTFHLP